LNLGLCSGRGSAPLFIAWWGARAPLDQTDLMSGRDDSSKAVEEASGRGGQTLAKGVGWRQGGAGRPHLVVSVGPLAPRVF